MRRTLRTRSRWFKAIAGSPGSRLTRGSVLATHPAIREAAVVGVPDEKWGEAPVAFVVSRQGAELPWNDMLIEFCKQALAGYKVPRRFEVVSELPPNPTGKVLKQELRQRV